MKRKALMMRAEWDKMARRNAFYSVASFAEFEKLEAVDIGRFWETGRSSVDLFLAEISLGNTQELGMVEIGCGLGRMTRRFAELFKHVYAIDVSLEMVKRAKEYWGHLSNVDFILGSGYDLYPLADASVEFVFSFLSLQHVPSPDIVLNYIRESARVLKPDGIAFLQFQTNWQLKTSACPSVFRKTVDRLLQPIKQTHHIYKRLLRVLSDCVKSRQYRPQLKHEFYLLYESWRGCSIHPEAVDALASQIGFRIENVEGLGTQYTYYLFRKVRR